MAKSKVTTLAAPAKLPESAEIMVADTRLWGAMRFAPYNPDDLVGKKGLAIYDDMRRDDQVKACLELKKLSILGPGWKIEPGGERRKDRKAAEFVEAALSALPGTFDEVLYSMLSALEYGFSVTERVAHVIDDGPWAGYNAFAALKSRAPHDIDFRSDEFGNLLAIRQSNRQGGVKELDPSRFVVFVHQQRFSNWYGESDLRAAYAPWWTKQTIRKLWPMFLERFSVPTVLGRYPRGIPEGEIAKWEKVVNKIQGATAIVAPEDLKLEFVELKGGRDSFEAALNRQDLAIAKALLVPNLLGLAGGEPETGSFARSQTHFEVWMAVLQGTRSKLEEAINEQIVAPLHEWNFQPTVERPVFRFLPLSEENKQAIAERWTQAVAGGAVLPTAEDENHLRTLLGFPEKVPAPEAGE